MSKKAEEYITLHRKLGRNYSPWVSIFHARKAVEIAREEVIEEAVKWLNGNIADYFGHSPVYSYVEDFRKYMEEKA